MAFLARVDPAAALKAGAVTAVMLGIQRLIPDAWNSAAVAAIAHGNGWLYLLLAGCVLLAIGVAYECRRS